MKLKKNAKKEFVIANLAEGKQSHSRWSKHGVSLVTVLLFMLVATIAATATYKWITSEGHSSASRMIQREAYQSAMAGIENARSWMTYNANDFGALVTQYFSNGKKAILMTPKLQASLNDKGQQFNVWLTGVEVNANGTYKVQILSAGEARGGAKHSEEAIFNVVGLYRVNVPHKEEVGSATTSFNYNYFGGGMKNAGDLQVKSMLINGSLNSQNNPIHVSTNLVVTGNVEISGTGVAADTLMCIGGNLTSQNGMGGGDIYVHGNFTSKNGAQVKVNGSTVTKNLTGNAYIEGNIEQKDGNLVFPQHLKLDGTWAAHLNGYEAGVGMHLCLGPNGTIREKDAGKTFEAVGSVYIEGARGVKNSASNYAKIVLGKADTAYVYSPYVYSTGDYTHEYTSEESCIAYRNCKLARLFDGTWHQHYPSARVSNAYQTDRYFLDKTVEIVFEDKHNTGYSNYYWNGLLVYDKAVAEANNYDPAADRLEPTDSWTVCTRSNSPVGVYGETGSAYLPTCTINSWFKSNGTISTTMPSSFDCGQDVKERCSALWQSSTSGCPANSDGTGSTSYIVPDVIKTGIGTFGGEKYANVFSCVKTIINGVDPQGNVLNGYDFSNFSTCYDRAKDSVIAGVSNPLYNGYLVVKFGSDNFFKSAKGTLTGKFIFIVDQDFGSGSKVYLPTTGSDDSFVFMYFKEGCSGDIQPIDASSNYNYFIYTKKDITQVLFNNASLNGSIYGEVGPKASPTCAKVKTFQTGKMIYNQNLLNSLAAAGIICDTTVANCGGTASSSPSSSASSTSSGSTSSASALNDLDVYHIATAPQLGITLESQYESPINAPPAANVANFAPSFLVMPRVIYLPTNPVGRLEDYYSIINLNGAAESKNPSKVNCVPPEGGTSLKTAGKLYSGEALSTGVHTCTYSSGTGTYANNGSGSGNVEFYVVVEGVAATAPSVYFTSPSAELISGGETNAVPVNLSVPEASHGQFSVDVTVSTLPSGWHLNLGPGTALRSGNVYTVTVGANAPSQNAFNIYADDGAVAGTVTFQLTSPCTGCTIGSQNVENVVMTGSAIVTRGSIADYCAAYGASCNNDNKYASVANRPDCNTDKEWVTANCTGSSTQSANNTWRCGTNTAITLRSVNVPSGCELFIPLENNTISAPQNGGNYTLYASLKRIPYTLTIHRKGASSGNTKVKVFVSETNTFSETPTYTCSNNECSFSVYSAQRVKLTYELSAPDKFSYWYSTSPNSPSTERMHTGSYTLQPISSDNTVLAQFNAKDLHCFYEDFQDLHAFCSNDVPCIANCNAAVSSSCEASVEATNRWQLAYNNSSNAPVISGGSIYNNGENPALVLSNKHAGKNGKMTAMLQTTVLKSTSPANLGVNSGLVIRAEADASSYLIVNFLGYGDSFDGTLKARLCKSTGKGSGNSTSNCESHEFSPSLEITPTSMIKVEMDVNGESLTIRATVDGTEGETSFTLNGDYALNGEYVGMKLSDRYFTLYDIGWSSTSFLFEGETCWDVPAIYCSFKANYLGSQVPQDSNVTPWVDASSWFTENGCEIAYYYSGEDNHSSMVSNTGDYDHLLASSTYNFSEEGLHGQTNQTGETKHNDALVAVTSCPLTTSLVGKNSSCGYFQVGIIDKCSMDYDILSTTSASKNGVASTDLTIDAPNTSNGINLRETTLDFTISGLADNQTIRVYLKDASGKLSLPGYITGNGNSNLNVSVMSDVEPFDPQHVVAVVMNGTSTYTVSAIKASCPYVFGISNCKASYNGTSWIVTSTISNPDGAASNGCSVSSDDSNIDMTLNTDINCPQDGKFTISDGSFYSRLNQNGNTQPMEVTFTISGKNSEQESVTPCVATSESYYPSAITCEPISVFKGQEFPAVTFDISNCPDAGCGYTVKYDGCNETGCSGTGTYKSGTPATFKPDPAPSTSDMTASTSTYNYVITYLGQTKTCPIEVKEPSPATATCAVTNGVVSGTITGAEWGESVTAVIGLSDLQGNVLGTYTVQAGNTETYEYDLKAMSLTPGHTYAVTLTLNGVGQTCTNPSYTPPLDGFTLECPTGYVYDTGKSLALTGCDGEPACGEWSITPSNDGVSLTTSTSAVTIANAVPGTTYTVSGERGTGSSKLTRSCSITFREPFSVKCNSTNTQDTIGNQSAAAAGDQITVTPYDVKGCYGECSYAIKKGTNTTVSSTYDDATGSVSFTDAAGSGQTAYRLEITNNGTTKPCTFNVEYPGADVFACSYAARVPGGVGSQNLSASGVPHAEYDLYIDDVKKVSAVWDNGGGAPQFNFTTPTTLGTHTYKVTKKGETTKQCQGSFEVTKPITCSVSPTTINGSTSVTFTALIDTAMNSRFGLNLHDCGFKKNGSWKDDDQNPHGGASGNNDTWTTTIASATEFTYECKQGNGDKTCSKTVVLQAPPVINNCSDLTSTKSNGATSAIVPSVDNCAANCEYHISGAETIDHATQDWSGGSISLTTGTNTTKSYRLKIANPYVAVNDTPYCDFSVTFTSAAVCHAPTGCSTVIITEDFQWDGRCYFFTSISWLNNQNSGAFQINGGGSYNGYVGSWSLPEKIDGGYYVKTNDNPGRCCGKDGTIGTPTCN